MARWARVYVPEVGGYLRRPVGGRGLPKSYNYAPEEEYVAPSKEELEAMLPNAELREFLAGLEPKFEAARANMRARFQ